MRSVDNSEKVRVGTTTDKDAGHPVSVRFPDARLEKLVRRAAVERDTNRSAFIVEAAVRVAREVLRLQREEDFRDWLDAAA